MSLWFPFSQRATLKKARTHVGVSVLAGHTLSFLLFLTNHVMLGSPVHFETTPIISRRPLGPRLG